MTKLTKGQEKVCKCKTPDMVWEMRGNFCDRCGGRIVVNKQTKAGGSKPDGAGGGYINIMNSKAKLTKEEIVYPEREYLLTPKGKYKVILRSPVEHRGEGVDRYTIEVENAEEELEAVLATNEKGKVVKWFIPITTRIVTEKAFEEEYDKIT